MNWGFILGVRVFVLLTYCYVQYDTHDTRILKNRNSYFILYFFGRQLIAAGRYLTPRD